MKTILLIEDNREVRENTAEILELSNYKVLVAEHGKQGVEMARRDAPDLIICDVMMPELDGFGVLHLLSKSPATASIPFIFLTAKAEKDDIRKGMNLGADDYLTKPFDDLELLDAVETRLRKNSLVKEEFQKNADGLNSFLTKAQGLKELDSLTSSEKRIFSIRKKHVIYAQGSYPNFLYFVSKGKVKTFKTDSLGNEFITGLHHEGDFVGYIDLLENMAYSESAVALEDGELCSIQKEDFAALIYNHKDVANKFIKMLANNVLEKEDRLLKLAYGSVRKRVAEALLLLKTKYTNEGSDNFSIPISRDDLSSIVGAAKETVIRMLTDFKEEGLIQISGSTITIINADKLLAMKN